MTVVLVRIESSMCHGVRAGSLGHVIANTTSWARERQDEHAAEKSGEAATHH
jgi:hypothetical protein